MIMLALARLPLPHSSHRHTQEDAEAPNDRQAHAYRQIQTGRERRTGRERLEERERRTDRKTKALAEREKTRREAQTVLRKTVSGCCLERTFASAWLRSFPPSWIVCLLSRLSSRL